MSLTSRFGPLFSEFEHDVLVKVGACAAQAQAGDVYPAVKEAMAELSTRPDDIDLLFGVLSYTSRNGTPTEKLAAAKLLPLIGRAAREIDAEFTKSAQQGAPIAVPRQQRQQQSSQATPEQIASVWGQPHSQWSGKDKAQTALSVAALLTSIAPFAAAAFRNKKRKEDIQKSHVRMLMEHPELRSEHRLPEYLQTMSDFAPDVAANPLIAGNVMKNLHRIGPEGFTASTLKELMDLQKMKNEQGGRPDALKGIAEALGHVHIPSRSSK